ncbi:MAG TPA: Uma2 family endonuclease [Ktedonobacteraceae bacterium]|jgi:Uma2 family endonuclease|nr:Uma2 family endonuclease [Ktedonobacteraceae bacterium]
MSERSSEKTISYYYDSHPTEEDLMGEATQHHAAAVHLEEVLKWLFHEQPCAVYVNLNFYVTDDENEYPIVPDVAVIKGVPYREEISWRIGVTGPAPQVVFEVASDKTWKRDREEKPAVYAQIGVLEYYAFDPFEPPLPLSRRKGQRLFGWHYDAATGRMQRVSPEIDGRLWSPQLNSWLKPDGKYLCLYDRLMRRRPTEKEVEMQARQDAVAWAEQEAYRAKVLAEKLRELGIDPDRYYEEPLSLQVFSLALRQSCMPLDILSHSR